MNRDSLKTAYLLCFDTFATTTPEVAEELGVSTADARKVLNGLGDLVVSDHVNGERTVVWQCWSTYDSIDRDEAIALFDAKFPVETEIEPTQSNYATGDRYTDKQLAEAAERKLAGETWNAIAASMGIKTPARLSMRVRRAGLI